MENGSRHDRHALGERLQGHGGGLVAKRLSIAVEEAQIRRGALASAGAQELASRGLVGIPVALRQGLGADNQIFAATTSPALLQVVSPSQIIHLGAKGK